MFDAGMLKMFLGEDQINAIQNGAQQFAVRAMATEQAVQQVLVNQGHILQALAMVHHKLGITGMFVPQTQLEAPQPPAAESEPQNAEAGKLN